MSYIMYICPGCRSYFKTGSPGKKIKCLRCKSEYLTDLKITDEEWRKLDQDARQSRIRRAIAGEQLREEIPVKEPAKEGPPVVDMTADKPEKEGEQAKLREDLPDEVILEARHILEQRDMEAEMPKQPIDRKRFGIVCGVTGGLFLLLIILNLVVPIFRIKSEIPVLAAAEEGDIVSFGKYKGNTQWIVLERDDRGLLMVSDFAVANAVPPETKDKISQLEWLNSSFVNRAFNIYERRKLDVINEDFSNCVIIMDETEMSRYEGTIELPDDGRVHVMCRVITEEN